MQELVSLSLARRVVVGGVPFDVRDMGEAVDEVLSLAASTSPHGTAVRLSNAYCVALASTDAEYRDVLHGPGRTYPDGAPVAWLMRRSESGRDAGRVRGPSFFAEVLDHGRAGGIRHYILGSTEHTLTELVGAIAATYPGAQVVGHYPPPFGPLGEAFYADCVTRICDAAPDIVWIGLGTPKQDFVTAELARRLPGVFVGVGAAFDFLAGTVREAPPWVQNSGLEWAYRLCREPRRLWRRYLFGNARFMWVALRER